MKWIDEQAEFNSLVKALGGVDRFAIDTEADSLHSYFDKVCLVQISTPSDDYVIDPLARIELSPLGEVLSNRQIRKAFHGADYDLRILNRDFGFTIANVSDTMIMAQLLGYSAVGLAALLKHHFDIEVDKKHQLADWAIRPLPADMLRYASDDTHHLLGLTEKMTAELHAKGRWEWAREEFERLETIRFKPSIESDLYRKVKGASRLEPRSLAILERLVAWRDSMARERDVPPFKVIGNESMIEISEKIPREKDALAAIKGVGRYHARYAGTILQLVEDAMSLEESLLPERFSAKPWNRDRELERRVERLKKARDIVAKELAIDTAVLAPKHLLTAIATMQPADVEQLREIPAMREWQRGVVGQVLVDALKRS